MDEQSVMIHKFGNGMTLVAESIKEVASGAFVFLLPGGAAHDPQKHSGSGTVLSELVFRGAGAMDNRALNDRLDGLGLQRNNHVLSLHSSLSGGLVADNLLETLEIYADIIRKPILAPDQFEACRQLSLQALESLEDDPRQKLSLLIHEKFLPYPFGRPSPGKKDQLQTLDVDVVRRHWADYFSPQGTILAVAGNINFDRLKKTVEENFGSWQGREIAELPDGKCQSQFYHQPNEGAQVHIGLMYPSVNVVHKDYYKALAAVGVLSGGMGSRLFAEVREKRGLCYAVGANHRVTGKFGAVQCYVGSSPDKAQEAMDVMIAELVKLADGITQDELDRAKVGLRASLIMQGESTSARAAACAGDYYYLGRVRSLEEIEQEIVSLTVDDVVDFARKHKAENFTVATIGPKELKI